LLKKIGVCVRSECDTCICMNERIYNIKRTAAFAVLFSFLSI
jgi:hypothetical protein